MEKTVLFSGNHRKFRAFSYRRTRLLFWCCRNDSLFLPRHAIARWIPNWTVQHIFLRDALTIGFGVAFELPGLFRSRPLGLLTYESWRGRDLRHRAHFHPCHHHHAYDDVLTLIAMSLPSCSTRAASGWRAMHGARQNER